MYRIVAIDRRKVPYTIGYYKTLEEANKRHDKGVWGDPYWKNMGIEFVETSIHKMLEH
jgi:hypothetical protein